MQSRWDLVLLMILNSMLLAVSANHYCAAYISYTRSLACSRRKLISQTEGLQLLKHTYVCVYLVNG